MGSGMQGPHTTCLKLALVRGPVESRLEGVRITDSEVQVVSVGVKEVEMSSPKYHSNWSCPDARIVCATSAFGRPGN